MDNASDTRQLKEARKSAKALDAERSHVWLQVMGSPAGRRWIYDRLAACHVFASTFDPDPHVAAFREGGRNIGLRDLAECLRYTPDQYVQMLREAADREVADGRRNERSRRGAGTDSDTGIIGADYDPTSFGLDTSADDDTAQRSE